MALECSYNFPHYFSYINPFFGGSHRVPIALNDSNFDYGQDLFAIRNWIKKQTHGSHARNHLKTYGLLSGHGRLWLGDLITPATDESVRRALIQKETGASVGPQPRIIQLRNKTMPREVLIVSRGLTLAEPWAVRYSTFQDASTSGETREMVRSLLRYPPDLFITPTIAVYFLDKIEVGP